MNTVQNRLHIIGIILILSFNILSGIQAVFLSSLLQRAKLFPSICIIFSIVLLFFWIVNTCKGLDKTIKKVNKNKKNVFLINITTAGSWFGFFAALKYIEPAISSSLANSVGPIFTIIITTYLLKTNHSNKHEVIAAMGVFSFVIYMIYNTYSGNSAVGVLSYKDAVLGILMSFLCGLSISLNTIVSKSLNASNIEPYEIMSIRFFLLVIAAFIISGIPEIIETLALYWKELLMIAAFGNIVPLFILQVGIKKSEALTVSFCLVSAPLFYLIIQSLDNRTAFATSSLIGIVGSILFIIYGIYAKTLLQKNRGNM